MIFRQPMIVARKHKKPGRGLAFLAFCVERGAAATYSPTQSLTQYHRR